GVCTIFTGTGLLTWAANFEFNKGVLAAVAKHATLVLFKNSLRVVTISFSSTDYQKIAIGSTDEAITLLFNPTGGPDRYTLER
ncbi:MAG: hypothetical protein MK003_14580, partial [Pseudomonadales bacterium]|nr:hypothetical protein [Pseudomonadales bacterium]